MMSEDRYEILEQLGVGGAGSVFKVWDKRLQRFLAVKRLLPVAERTTGGDLEKEAAALSALQHPNVVSVFDLDEMDGQPCLLMEFLNGENLDETVQRGKLELDDFYIIATHCLEGLRAAHSVNIQHRDIKPSNIMVTWLPDGTYVAKMLDFGLAEFSVRARNQVTQNGEVFGSIHFMAPEQFHNRPIDGRTDLYSLGAVLYYMLSCKYAFNGATNDEIVDAHLAGKPTPLVEIRPEIPNLVAEWVHWLVQRHPERRPQTVQEALSALNGIRDGSLESLPIGNRLKTQAIPRPSIPPESPPTSIASNVPRTHVAAVAPPVFQTASPVKSNKPLIMGGGAAALIAIIAFLATRGEKPAETSSTTQPAEPQTTVQGSELSPPTKGLVIWCDGESGLKTNKGSETSAVGQPVDLWFDKQADSGGNHIHYLFSRFKIIEDKLPKAERVDNKFGFVGSHQVVRFNVDSNLCLYTSESDATQPSLQTPKKFFNAPVVTMAFLIRPSKQSRAYFHAAGLDTNRQDWVLYTENGNLVTELTSKEHRCSVPLESPDGFSLCLLQRDNQTSTNTIFTRSTDQQKFISKKISLNAQHTQDINRVRLGRNNQRSRESKHDFEGDVAMVLVYTRALLETERLELSRYVSNHYYGK